MALRRKKETEMKIKSKVTAGGLRLQHNQVAVKPLKSGGFRPNHNQA